MRNKLKAEALEIKKVMDKWQNIDMLAEKLPDKCFMGDLITRQSKYIDELESELEDYSEDFKIINVSYEELQRLQKEANKYYTGLVDMIAKQGA